MPVDGAAMDVCFRQDLELKFGQTNVSDAAICSTKLDIADFDAAHVKAEISSLYNALGPYDGSSDLIPDVKENIAPFCEPSSKNSIENSFHHYRGAFAEVHKGQVWRPAPQKYANLKPEAPSRSKKSRPVAKKPTKQDKVKVPALTPAPAPSPVPALALASTPSPASSPAKRKRAKVNELDERTVVRRRLQNRKASSKFRNKNRECRESVGRLEEANSKLIDERDCLKRQIADLSVKLSTQAAIIRSSSIGILKQKYRLRRKLTFKTVVLCVMITISTRRGAIKTF